MGSCMVTGRSISRLSTDDLTVTVKTSAGNKYGTEVRCSSDVAAGGPSRFDDASVGFNMLSSGSKTVLRRGDAS